MGWSAADQGGAPEDDGVLQLGRSIRSRRRVLGLTLVQLASLSGLSQPFLSQVERGVARPSMRSLSAIARALGTTGPALLALPDGGPISVLRSEQALAVDFAGGVARSIARGDRGLLPMEFLGGPRQFEEYFQHEGEEVLYVVSGVIEVDLEGSPIQTLGVRDSLFYDASIRHRWRVVGDEPVWLLAVSNRQH